MQPTPDLIMLNGLDPRSLEPLEALSETASVRAAAARLGLHHSTVQQQATSLAQSLGHDPRTPGGRVRFILAKILQLLTRPTLPT